MNLRPVCWLLVLCAPAPGAEKTDRRDVHSYSRPELVRVRHVDLALTVDFDRKVIAGTATLTVERGEAGAKAPLILDSRDLKIEKVETSPDGRAFAEARFEVGKADPILGAPVTVPLPEGAKFVRVRYRTSPGAGALQWLDREQTAGKRHPFLYTQSQAIQARTWLPLQDTPGVRVTYTATVGTPKQLRAVMSAADDRKAAADGSFRFEMKEPIPSYLIALAVGELAFREVGPRTGVYAEPGVVDRAAREFADMEDMLKAAESLYGPYRWGRYDVLVLPPSFPFGGMENPRLTFLSPTVLAGDRSLVSLVAHELAHSWSGNLVSNATWRDFWLNEGFTVYVERRIMEKVYGKTRADMEALLGRRGLERGLKGLKAGDQVLHIDLAGRDPDDAVTEVPYEKGALFLRHIERAVGRDRFDAFLKGYFEHFAFKSITTADFLGYLGAHLVKDDAELWKKLAVDEWVRKPGIPAASPVPSAEALGKVEALAKEWLAGKAELKRETTAKWSTHEWLHFLRSLPDDLGGKRMKELDDTFELTATGNSEVLFQWLLMAIRADYSPAYPRLTEFLTTQGRRKFLQPLYAELVKTPRGKERALEIYRKARPLYHPIAAATIDAVVGRKK